MELKGTARLIAMQAKSVEELLELAKEHEYSISREEAEEVFAQLSKEGELADDELEDVAGGACYSKDPHGYLIVTSFDSCRMFAPKLNIKSRMGYARNCRNCTNMWSPGMTMYCKARTKYDDHVRGTHTRTISG